MPSTLRHRSLAWLALTASMTPGLAAQAPLRTFLLRNAKDTIAVEQVKRTPGRLEGDLLLRSTNQRLHYVATLSPDELVVSIENEFRFATDSAGAPARQAVHVEFVGDSVVVAMAGRGAAPQRVASRLGALPWINPSFGLAEQAVRRGLVLKGEAQSVPLFALAGGTTVLADLTRVGTDSVLLTLGGVPIHLGITTGGSIRGGVIPAQGLMLDVIDGAVQNTFVASRPDYSAPADAPYIAIPMRIPTSMGHTLAGTLTMPQGAAGPVPAVITITGSGPEDRDEAIPPVPGYRPFREVADALGRRGIAVLRMDDRGFGESEGVYSTATSQDLADDIRAGLAFLRARPDIDGKRLGLIGHSEGGMIAPMVAATDSALKGIVLMAGPAFTGRKILEFQNRFALDRAPNLTPRSRDSLLAAALTSLDSVATGQPWLRFFLSYDPTVTAPRVHTPVLILQGATDQQVTAEQAPLLEGAFRAGGNRNVTLHVYPATNHLFLADPDGNPAGYSKLQVTAIRPEVLRDIVEWLTRWLQ